MKKGEKDFLRFSANNSTNASSFRPLLRGKNTVQTSVEEGRDGGNNERTHCRGLLYGLFSVFLLLLLLFSQFRISPTVVSPLSSLRHACSSNVETSLDNLFAGRNTENEITGKKNKISERISEFFYQR